MLFTPKYQRMSNAKKKNEKKKKKKREKSYTVMLY